VFGLKDPKGIQLKAKTWVASPVKIVIDRLLVVTVVAREAE
jgi:hypothetical protein